MRTQRTPNYEKSGDVIMPFGKHKGSRLRDIPHDYLSWVESNLNLRPQLREAIEMELMLGEDIPYEGEEDGNNADQYR